MSYKSYIIPLLAVAVLAGVYAIGESTAISASESNCISCHKEVSPGIVEQFLSGRKAEVGLDCSTCHGDDHNTMDDAVNSEMPTPDTCRMCHPTQYDQYAAGKHSLAWVAMEAMPMLSHQPSAVGGADMKGCSACHKIGLKTEAYTATTGFEYGTGACDSCHTRHTFSKEEARDPRACMTCHMGFDHPQWEMWSTSKHGAIWQIEGDTGRAPTCVTCHMQEGNHEVRTSWGFLALRLPEDDPEWMADRAVILQALGVLDWEGNPTARLDAVKAADIARLEKEPFDELRATMLNTCSECHSTSFAKSHLDSSDQVIRDADALMAEAILEVKSLYDAGIFEVPEGWEFAPDLLQFYDAESGLEQELWVMFLEYRMRAFQGAFHANPDYMHWYGWAEMKNSLARIKEEAADLREEHGVN